MFLIHVFYLSLLVYADANQFLNLFTVLVDFINLPFNISFILLLAQVPLVLQVLGLCY